MSPFDRWHAVGLTSGLTSTEKVVLYALVVHADEAERCSVGVERIGRYTGLTERAVQKALASLSGKCIDRVMVKGRATEYRVRFDRMADPASKARGYAGPAFVPGWTTPAPRSPPHHVHPYPRTWFTPTPARRSPHPRTTFTRSSLRRGFGEGAKRRGSGGCERPTVGRDDELSPRGPRPCP